MAREEGHDVVEDSLWRCRPVGIVGSSSVAVGVFEEEVAYFADEVLAWDVAVVIYTLALSFVSSLLHRPRSCIQPVRRRFRLPAATVECTNAVDAIG